MLSFLLTLLIQPIPGFASGAQDFGQNTPPWIEAAPVASGVLAPSDPDATPLTPEAGPASEMAATSEADVAIDFVSAPEAEMLADTSKTPSPIVIGLLSSFALPLSDWLEPEHDSEWRNLVSGLSISASTSVPFTKRELLGRVDEEVGPVVIRGRGTQGERSQNLTLRLGLRYRPITNWFATATYYHYLEPEVKRSWDPDFVYAFGYDDWRPHTLSLTYANYGGNRLQPDRASGERMTSFTQGAITAGYKFPMPEALQSVFSATKKGRISHQVSYSVVPEFTTASGERGQWKQKASLSTRYSIHGMWYVSATVNVYPIADQQQPWDPDFVYGFGLFDWRPGNFSVQYANYSGMRFPWRESSGAGRFIDGGLSFSWSTAF